MSEKNEWKPIESAPKTGRTLLLGYWNSRGNWRTVRGQWMSAAYIAEFWEEPDDVEEGWFETSAESDDLPNCWPVTPSHWQPLPAAPCQTCNGHGMVGGLTPHSGYDSESCPDCRPPPASAQDDAKDDFGMSPYCPECDGGGRISVLSDNSPDAHDVDIDCTHCDGSGSAAYAATNLAKALQRERMQHLQMYGEYKNFHRSLSARFGYGHDEIHFRRDLVSLEEAIAAKVAAPAAGDARDTERLEFLVRHRAWIGWSKDRECCAVYRRDDEGYTEPMTGWTPSYPTPREAIDAALAASQQQEG